MMRGVLAVAMLSCLLTYVSPAFGGTVNGNSDKGKPLFQARCSFCHGPTGRGDGPAGAALKPPPTNFSSPEYWKSADINRLRAVLKSGKQGTAMPPSQLAPEEIDDVIAYLRTLAK